MIRIGDCLGEIYGGNFTYLRQCLEKAQLPDGYELQLLLRNIAKIHSSVSIRTDKGLEIIQKLVQSNATKFEFPELWQPNNKHVYVVGVDQDRHWIIAYHYDGTRLELATAELQAEAT